MHTQHERRDGHSNSLERERLPIVVSFFFCGISSPLSFLSLLIIKHAQVLVYVVYARECRTPNNFDKMNERSWTSEDE